MKLTKAEKWVLRALTDGANTSSKVVSKVELHRVYVLRILKKLADQGLINRVIAVPTYEVSDMGKIILEENIKERS
jgi:predicted transcriptional regulator